MYSESANQARSKTTYVDVVVSKVAPVQLEPSREQDYLGTFFANKRSRVTIHDYRAVGTYLLAASIGINRCFHLIQTILANADYLDDSDPQDLIAYLKRAASEVNASTKLDETNRERRKLVQSFNAFLHDNSAYVMKDSERYSGGKDIIVQGSGARGSHGTAPKWHIVYPASKLNSNVGGEAHEMSQAEYERTKLEKYSTDMSLRALRAAKEIQELLIGTVGSPSSLGSPVSTRHAFDFDFSKVEKILLRNLGMKDSFGFFNEYHNTLKSRSKFATNFQVLIQRQPLLDVENRLRRIQQLKERAERNGREALSEDQREMIDKGSAFDNIPEERQLCAVSFAASIVINLQEDFCRYITQTDKGPIPTYSLVSWFNPWSRYFFRAKNQSSTGGEQLKLPNLPRYIVSAQNSKKLDAYRKELGYHVDGGRSDSAGMTIGPRGNLMYMPNAADTDLSVALEFEKSMSEYLDKTFEYDLGQGTTIADDNRFKFDDADAKADELNEVTKKVKRYSGALLVCNWDYNTIQYVSKSGDRITTVDTTGATKPSDIAIAEYLGMNMAREGERPIQNDFADSLAHVLDGVGQNSSMYVQPGMYRYSYDSRSNLPEKFGILTFRTFRNLFQAIVYGITRKTLPDLSTVIKESKDELDLITTNSNVFEQRIYAEVMDENFNLVLPSMTPDQINTILMSLLSAAMKDAEGTNGTNLFREVSSEHGMNADVEVKNHPRYFDRSRSTLSDFGNVYNYFGGLVFKKYCEALIKLKPSQLTASSDIGADGKPVPDYVTGYSLPGFNILSSEVMPFAAMFAKYVPESMEYFERAEKTMEDMEPDSSIEPSDITMSGIAEGSKLFPHQLDAHRTLRRRPKFSILDISPGGGKTITVLTDIGCVVEEDPDPIRALVVCPSRLVGNWCEDMTKISNGNWNVFPLDTEIVNRWSEKDEGIDGLIDLMKSAPPNTVFVAGLSFIKSKPFPVSFGARAVTAFGGVEILKRIGFNYIAFDESHKAKRLISGVHKAVKSLTTMADVKYVRLATGTFVPKEIHDVVGQTALFTSSIFKNLSYFKEEFAKNDEDRETKGSFAPDAPFRVRSKLGRNTAVIAKKRKEWAFMLPSPQDFLIEVDMEANDNPGSVIHRQTYQALLQTLEEDLKVSKKRKPEGEEDDVAGDDEDLPESGDAIEDDEAFSSEVGGDINLEYQLQRLEQLVTDPWGDEAGAEALQNAGFTKTNFVPEKIKSVLSRIKGHFGSHDNGEDEANGSIRAWTPGIICRELDLVEYDGELWLARKKSDGPNREMLPPSNTPPTADKAWWKNEARGKLIVFTRYKRSCKAVFESLPPEYKSMAVAYHGDEPKRTENLDAFKNDPNVKIIVANEQSITEGHNLQMASRIIRVDTPWTPGDFEQSTARIFRPDTSAAELDEHGNAGEMKREVIFVDWVMTSNSSEVVKVARLLSRSVEVVKYEEAENPHYEELHDLQIPLVSMGWNELIQGGTVDLYYEHFNARRILNELQRSEFHDMRSKTVAAMIPIEASPVREDFKTMPVVPIAANQKIADKDGHGFERLFDYLDHDNFAHPLTRSDVQNRLIGLPVRTERGYGILKDIGRVSYKSPAEYGSNGEKLLDPHAPICGKSVKVVYPGDTEAYSESSTSVHVSTTVTDAIYDSVYKGKAKRKAKKSEKTRTTERKKERKEDNNADKRSRANAVTRVKVGDNLKRNQRTTEKRKKRKENIRSGKKVNSGIDVIKSDQKATRKQSGTKIVKDTPNQKGADMRLRIIPSLYDGYIAIHANMRDPDAENLTEYGFVEFGSYLYIEAKRYDPFWNIIEWTQKQLSRQRLTFDRKTEKRLEAIQDAYDDRDKLNYNVKLAAKTANTLPTFFRTRHMDMKDKTKVKAYPMVLPDRVRLCIDAKTNPRVEKWAGRKVAGVPGAGWKLHEGMNIFLATSKSEAKRKIKDLVAAGYSITNLDKATSAIDDMKLTRSITKARGE
jgi:hypothetical protein